VIAGAWSVAGRGVRCRSGNYQFMCPRGEMKRLDPETSLLQKPFTPTELARRVREMLDAAARRRD
jgi:hypothetical protein